MTSFYHEIRHFRKTTLYYQVYDYFYEILDSLNIAEDGVSVNIQNNYNPDTDKKKLLESLKRQQLWSEPFLPNLMQNSEYPAGYKGFVFVFTRQPSYKMIQFIKKLENWRVNFLVITNGQMSITEIDKATIMQAPLVSDPDSPDDVSRRNSQQQVADFLCDEVNVRCTPDEGETVIHGTDSVKTDCGTFSCLGFNQVFDDQKQCAEPEITECYSAFKNHKNIQTEQHFQITYF